jgi:phage-related tail fiber protein
VTDNPFILNVELIRWASASDYITKQTCISSGTKRIYERFCSSGTWTSWTQIAKTSDIPTSLPANGGHASTADKWQAARNIALTGDITGSASVDGSTDASIATTLKNSGVTVGTYRSVTVDAKGRVTAGTNPTTLAGYGITDGALKTDVQSSVQNVSTQPTNQMIGGIWFAPI